MAESFNPKCNQSTGVTTFGRPSAAEVAARMQAKHAAAKEEEKRYREALERQQAAKAEVEQTHDGEATQASLFWHDVKQ